MMRKMKVAVQVYSVRDDAAADFKGTAAKLKAMGYDALELAGMYDLSAKEIRAVLDEVGIPAISAHVPYQVLEADLNGTVADYATIGCKYIAIPYLTEEYRPGGEKYAETIAFLKQIGKACADAGIIMLYHNHDFEFIKLADGTFGLDDIYTQIGADLLQTEIDTCWVNVAGECPSAYVRKYTGRAPVVHLKDFFMEGVVEDKYELIGIEAKKKAAAAGKFEFRPVGHGMQDMPAICEAASDAGADWVVVEQDVSVGRPAMEAVEMSRAFLRTIGL